MNSDKSMVSHIAIVYCMFNPTGLFNESKESD